MPDDQAFIRAKGPLPLKFSLARMSDAIWRKAGRIPLDFRDIGLYDATSGVARGEHLRACGAGNREGWFAGEMDCYYLQVLGGTVELETTSGEALKLATHDVLMLPPFAMKPGVFRFSADFEALEFSMVGGYAIIDAHQAVLGRTAAPSAHSLYTLTREAPDSYITGDGPRTFFAYRDVGATAATGRRMHIHIVSMVDLPPGGTGWHTHTMDQFVMGFQGHLDISVEGQGDLRLTAGDFMTIPAGMRHNVTGYSMDWKVVEVCIPTDYDTTPAPAP